MTCTAFSSPFAGLGKSQNLLAFLAPRYQIFHIKRPLQDTHNGKMRDTQASKSTHLVAAVPGYLNNALPGNARENGLAAHTHTHAPNTNTCPLSSRSTYAVRGLCSDANNVVVI